MKHLFTSWLVLASIILTANDGIEKVDVRIEVKENVYYVKQSILIKSDHSTDDFSLRALPYEETQLFIDSILIDNKPTSFEIMDMTPIIDIRVEISNEIQLIEIYYKLTEHEDEFTIPIFFTSMSALNSEGDFFEASIIRIMDHHFKMIFPRVPINESDEGMIRTTSFKLPSTPSMIRLKRVRSSELSKSIEWVDWGVGLVFLIIGIILWVNRKSLAYG